MATLADRPYQVLRCKVTIAYSAYIIHNVYDACIIYNTPSPQSFSLNDDQYTNRSARTSKNNPSSHSLLDTSILKHHLARTTNLMYFTLSTGYRISAITAVRSYVPVPWSQIVAMISGIVPRASII